MISYIKLNVWYQESTNYSWNEMKYIISWQNRAFEKEVSIFIVPLGLLPVGSFPIWLLSAGSSLQKSSVQMQALMEDEGSLCVLCNWQKGVTWTGCDRWPSLKEVEKHSRITPEQKQFFCVKKTKWVSRDAPGQTFLRGGFLPSVHETSFIGLTSGTLGRIEPVKIITSGGVFVEQTSTWVA